jgi:hypothetical protein
MNEELTLYEQVRLILLQSQLKAIQQVNSLMVQTYFQIGKYIVEHEQKGKKTR